MAETNFQKRQPAFYVEIKELNDGNFVKTEGWDPNYITTSFGLNVSRVTIFGTVIETDDNMIKLDDSSGITSVRSFDEFKPFNIIGNGDYVEVIGKVRQFNNEIYLTPEICKKLDTEWISFRNKNIEKIKKLFSEGKIENFEAKESVSFSSGVDAVNDIVEEAVEQTEESNETNLIERVLSYIDSEDSGNGVEKVKILDHFDDSNSPEIIDTLIMEGDIFEVKPGVFKVLK